MLEKLLIFSTSSLLILMVGLNSSVTATIQEFRCRNGQSIPIQKFCDKTRDCQDGSDETGVSLSCPECNLDLISCHLSSGNTTCLINRQYICDGTITCQVGAQCDAGCPTHYRCHNKDCVERTTVCDGDSCDGCLEDDEWETGIGFQCVRQGKFCRIPQQLLWDGIKDCDQGEDLCYSSSSNVTSDGRDQRFLPSTSFNQSRCFKCLDNSMIIPRHKVCDDVIDCSDLSDECLCEGGGASICSEVKLRSDLISCYQSQCEVGQVTCGKGNCINRTSVCDSKKDCWDNRDERYAYCQGTVKCGDAIVIDEHLKCRCSCGCSSQCTPIYGVACNDIVECPPPGPPGSFWIEPPGFPEDECEATCPLTRRNFTCLDSSLGWNGVGLISYVCKSLTKNLTEMIELYDESKRCDGKVLCLVDGDDEKQCLGRFKCPNGDLISIPRSKLCDGFIDCDDGSDETTCPDRFYCSSLGGSKISIKNQYVCDFYINCDNNSDELNCTKDKRFYCESGQPLYVRRTKVFNGYRDCNDWSDECPTNSMERNENIFSSRYQLIANPILRAIVWIMGLLALIGNLIVFCDEVKSLNKILKKSGSASLLTNHMLVLNLAVSDFLMGIYLLILGIAGIVYDGVFCANKLNWLSSTTCSTMGVLVVLSSETSVLTMILLTSCRLYAILNPFKAAHKPTSLQVFLLICISWFISLFLAFLPFFPLLQDQFANTAMLEDNPYFQNQVVSLDTAKEWMKRMLTFDPNYKSMPDDAFAKIRGARSWNELNSIFEDGGNKSVEIIHPLAYFSYYSANSVCTPRFFVTTEDKAWQFSMAITIFNFVGFVYVALSYSYITYLTRRSALKHMDSSRSREIANARLKTMQRKVVRLIVTDFCCWVPISIMVFINFSGMPLSNVAYAVSAIILLPINSALNPILYSDLIPKCFLKCKKSVRDRNSITRASEKTQDTDLQLSTKNA